MDPVYAAALAAVAKYNGERYADPYGVSSRTASVADLTAFRSTLLTLGTTRTGPPR
jgi:hypothetical protein